MLNFEVLKQQQIATEDCRAGRAFVVRFWLVSWVVVGLVVCWLVGGWVDGSVDPRMPEDSRHLVKVLWRGCERRHLGGAVIIWHVCLASETFLAYLWGAG